MEAAVCVTGLLLLVSSAAVHLSPDPEPVFGLVGRRVEFRFGFSARLDYSALYRASAGGDLLLANCSQPEKPHPDGRGVTCVGRFYFAMTKLTTARRGDYRVDGWGGANVVGHRSFRLTVCVKGNGGEEEYVDEGGRAVVCRMNSTLGNGSRLQVYRYSHVNDRYVLVLDTNSSLEPFADDLRGRLQVDLNASLVVVVLSRITAQDRRFHCALWRGAECQRLASKSLYPDAKLVSVSEEENVTLPCILEGGSVHDVAWFTPSGPVEFNVTRKQEVMQHTQTGSSSLLIPSVSQQHSGLYNCWGRADLIQSFDLYVCPKVSPLDVMFSLGENVHLNSTPHLNFHSVAVIQWYRQKVLEPQVLILDSGKESSVALPMDLRGRVSWRNSSFSVILSNLTAEDDESYMWRVYGEDDSKRYICSEGSFRLVCRDPRRTEIGPRSPLYRDGLMGCVLLGLVAAVIWLKLRSRRGEQTSGRRSRQGQQGGGEDVHEEVEMVERWWLSST